MNLTTSDDPWALIEADATRLLGRRVQGRHVLSIYWVKGADGSPGLLFKDIHSDAIPSRLPRARGVSIRIDDSEEEYREVRIVLLEPADLGVFLSLCKDIVAYSSEETNSRSASAAVFRRLNHWQALLRRGNAEELTVQEARGLIGELYVLQKLAKADGIAAALRYWVAPEDHPQDFAMDTRMIEVKTRVTGSRQQVQISSLEQLEGGNVPLWLVAVELAPSTASDAISLNELAENVIRAASEDCFEVKDSAENLLLKRGYIAGRDYGLERYVVSGVNAYLIHRDFPRITRSGTDLRIKRAMYTLDLTVLGDFERSLEEVFGSAI